MVLYPPRTLGLIISDEYFEASWYVEVCTRKALYCVNGSCYRTAQQTNVTEKTTRSSRKSGVDTSSLHSKSTTIRILIATKLQSGALQEVCS